MIKKLIVKILVILVIFFSYPINIHSAPKKGINDKKNTNNISKKPKKNSVYQIALNKINKAKKLEKKNKISKANNLYQEALKNLHYANKNDPFNPEILNYLGFIYQKLDNLSDAEIYYIIGLEMSPKNFKINENLGSLYVKKNEINLAKKRLEVLRDCRCEEFSRLEKKIIENETQN